MSTDLPVSNPPTVDDALRALNDMLNYTPGKAGSLGIVKRFLEHLTKMGEPETVIASDQEGFVLEGAYQWGFDTIDDNADLLVVHSNDLIKFVMANRRTNKAANELKKLVEALEEMGIADPGQAMGGADTVDVMCQFYPRLKKALA